MKKSNIKKVVRKSNSFFFLLCFLGFGTKAQYIEQYAISQTNGNKMLEIKNYQEAVRQFSALLKKDPNNLEYQFKLGKSYNYSFIDKAKGLEILKMLHENTAEKPADVAYEYGVACYKNYLFEEAKAVFSSIKDETKAAEIQEWIKQCDIGKRMYQNPISVEFENLGKYVNSSAPDFLPLCLPDESVVTFTTRRNGVVGNLYDYGGYKTADIFISKHKRNKYSRARSIGNPNTYGNEWTAGKSENGSYFIYNVNSDDFFNDLFVSQMGKRSFMPPKVFDSKEVNKKSAETGATLTNDGERMYFSSDREGGLGGFDIYMVQRLPNGKWGSPKNIGAPINTSKDEKYPMLLDNGQTLYFSSNGHPGMGDLDLFKSTSSGGKWGKPKNLGYPVNTVDDDYNISFAKNKRHAYIAAKREDSYGDLDIYRITFLNEKKDYTLLQGNVLNSDSTVIGLPINVEVFDVNSGEVEGIYKVNEQTGKFSAALPPGKYTFEIIDVAGYKEHSQDITLLGKNDFQPLRKITILLIPE